MTFYSFRAFIFCWFLPLWSNGENCAQRDYDEDNRLLQGDYVARAGTTATAPWTAEAGNHRLYGVSYDDNGNILTLRRRGLLANATRTAAKQFGPVDMLAYRYDGNRLVSVDDQVSTNQLPRPAGYHGAPASLAGDFQEQGTRQQQEYFYDANGSLSQDRNKNITAVAYNHLALPRRIAFGTGADSLVFRYAASGQKVAKLVYQTGKPVQRTDYLGPYQYEQDSLRFFPHAEGRTLRVVNAISGAVTYQREYTVKDHLGNLRLAYRAGQRRTYAAGLEPSDAGRETQQFDSLSVSPPIAFAAGNLARTGTRVARLNAGGGAPQPLGTLIQRGVQKGDTITLTAHGLYPQAVSSTPFVFSLASFVAGLLAPAPGGPPRPDGRRYSLPLLNIGVSAALPALVPRSGGVPLAYVRLLVFNADSNLVSSQTQQLTSAALNNYEPLTLQLFVPQDGYVSAYAGNESNADVYFDDVTLVHGQGLQVQENHYDPWGLSLAGLDFTSPGLRGLNQYQFNSKENQLNLGLNWNHQDWRFYDYQIGRWHTVDPLAEKNQEMWTPYQFGFDNALRYNDPDGLEVIYAEGTTARQQRKFERQQDRLNRRSETASQNWKQLKTSKNVHTIHINGVKQGEMRTERKGEIDNTNGNGTDIYVNLKDRSIEGQKLPIGISIGHEEGHAFRFDKGLVPEVKSPSMAELKTKGSATASFEYSKAIADRRIAEEIAASQIENKIRAEYSQSGSDLPRREVYSNLSVPTMINGNLSVEPLPPVPIP